MITAQIENLIDVWPEMEKLFDEHWQKMAMWKDQVPLAPRKSLYFALANQNKMICCTLRVRGRLVGYWTQLIDLGLHYGTSLISQFDMWWIVPEFMSTVGPLMLARGVEKELRRRGAVVMLAGEKLHSPCGRLYEAIGMAPFERSWAKWIGKPNENKS